MYPLSAASNPPAQKFVNISGKQFNTVHANDFHFYEELNAVVQHEPADFLDSGSRRPVRSRSASRRARRSRRMHA